jgi:hypothetical protein
MNAKQGSVSKSRGPGGRLVLYHPFLFAVYPVIYLYARNLDEVTVSDLVKPVIVALVAAVILVALARVVVRDRAKAALIAAIALLMTCMYGHVTEGIRGMVVAGYVVGRGSVILPLWSLVTLALVVMIWRTGIELRRVNRFANVLSVVLVALPLGQTVLYYTQPKRGTPHLWSNYMKRTTTGPYALKPGPKQSRPDVYYIILDEYARKDALASYFGYDNTAFVKFLESRGFYVGSKSTSNYTSTYLSLSSSLNSVYLQPTAREVGVGDVDMRLMSCMIQDARAIHLLKNAGYKFVFFPSGFHVTNRNPNADLTVTRSSFRLSEFDRVLFDTTIFKPLNPAYRNYGANILYSFDELPEIAKMKEPTFTFAHITMPHKPYLFDAKGRALPRCMMYKEAMSKEEYRRLYTGQLIYVNKRMRRVIDGILANSQTPPVIIIQGDHGMKCKVEKIGEPPERLKKCILNTYYLPGGGRKLLYPTISPVNSFRVVFDYYLGGHYKLLKDMSYQCRNSTGKLVFSPIP